MQLTLMADSENHVNETVTPNSNQPWQQLLLLAMKYITLVSVFSYNVKRGAECGCGNSGQTVIRLGASWSMYKNMDKSSS